MLNAASFQDINNSHYSIGCEAIEYFLQYQYGISSINVLYIIIFIFKQNIGLYRVIHHVQVLLLVAEPEYTCVLVICTVRYRFIHRDKQHIPTYVISWPWCCVTYWNVSWVSIHSYICIRCYCFCFFYIRKASPLLSCLLEFIHFYRWRCAFDRTVTGHLHPLTCSQGSWLRCCLIASDQDTPKL